MLNHHNFMFSSRNWQMSSDRQAPGMRGIIFSNATVLSKIRMEHGRIVKSIECPCRHQFFHPRRFNNPATCHFPLLTLSRRRMRCFAIDNSNGYFLPVRRGLCSFSTWCKCLTYSNADFQWFHPLGLPGIRQSTA